VRASPPESHTRDRLLQAAVDVFASRGYHGATVDDIVAAADTSKGTFYYYFPSKQGIFLKLLAQLAGIVETGVERAILASGGRSPRSRPPFESSWKPQPRTGT
jgi:AcrR family transcriptional regulator